MRLRRSKIGSLIKFSCIYFFDFAGLPEKLSGLLFTNGKLRVKIIVPFNGQI